MGRRNAGPAVVVMLLLAACAATSPSAATESTAVEIANDYLGLVPGAAEVIPLTP